MLMNCIGKYLMIWIKDYNILKCIFRKYGLFLFLFKNIDVYVKYMYLFLYIYTGYDVLKYFLRE